MAYSCGPQEYHSRHATGAKIRLFQGWPYGIATMLYKHPWSHEKLHFSGHAQGFSLAGLSVTPSIGRHKCHSILNQGEAS